MKTEADKTVMSKSRAVANTASAWQDKGESEVLFADNRPQAVAQRKLEGKADNSLQAARIAQLQAMANGSSVETVQKSAQEDEELLQGRFDTVQKQGPEEEELLQGKFETVQKLGKEEEIQTKSAATQKKNAQSPNNTGLPDTLKSGIEGLSGVSMDDVKVHYNSPKPARLQAHAFAQGTDIHMAPGQDKHLPHEAWHVVQQKQGRVKPTRQMKGKVNVNDDVGLEKEADVMGVKALGLPLQLHSYPANISYRTRGVAPILESVIQRKLNVETIEQYKKTLMLNEVSIIELPTGGPKVVDKFSTYPAESLYNVPRNILAMSLLDVSMPGVEHDSDALGYYGSVTAHEMVNDMQGGGAFISPFKLAVICQGAGGRALQHEMGHAEQQESLGAQFGGEGTTVNQVILEYHNILTNENEHNDFEKVRTYYNHSNTGKHADKTWDNLLADATNEYPKNATLLEEIRVAKDEIFPEVKVEIEKNLISEYYVNVSSH